MLHYYILTNERGMEVKMLYKYKNDYQKIAMGLLSFIPDLKDFARLKQEIDWYQAEDNRALFLWKNEDEDFTGIIGVELNDEFIIVRQIAVSPAQRNEGVTYKMLTALSERLPNLKLMGNMETASFVTKWEQKRSE
ncbi:putative acetyltransferase [Ligilactobacillus saerimneri 30a]|nr:putative acetyltransferase [Ligilactobacillus saerimneri 30a]